jgi:cytochrome c-type biogenesis protein
VDLTLGAALLAGLLSFLSPCVLPVVPAYLGLLGVVAAAPVATPSPGLTAATATAGAASSSSMTSSAPARPSWGVAGGWTTFPNAVAFVLGFGSVFTLLGLFVYAVVGPLRGDLPLLRQLGGILLIVLGLNLMGVLHLDRLWRSWRPLDRFVSFRPARRQRRGVVGGFVLGAVFALGWTPCIGPTLGAILTFAALGAGPQVASLLVAYSLGLGIPFLLLAVAVDHAPAVTRPLVRHGHSIEVVGGALVVVMGLAILFDWLGIFARTFSTLWPQV